MGVAVLCVYSPEGSQLDVPVGQYKKYSRLEKGRRAHELADWLEHQSSKGMQISGFCNAVTQHAAANFGMEMLEELPDAKVRQHHDGFRLFFGNEWVSFAESVALMYYHSTVCFGVLRAGLAMPKGDKLIRIYMDRFPGPSPDQRNPGESLPKTQGAKFIEYVQTHSPTALHIREENLEIGIRTQLTTLDWWKPMAKLGEGVWQSGKTHPDFILSDWIVSAALAHSFPDGYLETFGSNEHGAAAVEGLARLYDSFKKEFSIWSFAGDKEIGLLKHSERNWTIPDSAREFIVAKAERI